MPQSTPVQAFISQSLTGAAWHFEHSDVAEAVIDRFSQLFIQDKDLPIAIARMLAARGLTPQSLDMFLEPRLRDLLPNPSDFKDMDKACALLAETIDRQ